MLNFYLNVRELGEIFNVKDKVLSLIKNGNVVFTNYHLSVGDDYSNYKFYSDDFFRNFDFDFFVDYAVKNHEDFEDCYLSFQSYIVLNGYFYCQSMPYRYYCSFLDFLKRADELGFEVIFVYDFSLFGRFLFRRSLFDFLIENQCNIRVSQNFGGKIF